MYCERKRQEIRRKEKRLEETLAKYESELEITDKKRKEIIQQAKTDAENLIKSANAKIESTIKTIKEAKAEKEKTKKARAELQNFIESPLNPPQGDLQKEKKVNKKQKIIDQSTNNPPLGGWAAGTFVRLKGQTAVGTILEIQDKHAVVAFGHLKSTVKLSELEAVSKNQQKKEINKYEKLGKTVTDDVRERKLNFKSEIDVRGMRGDEALQAVTYFIDDALMVGVESVRILHGTGTGILRQLIRQYLSTVHGVKKFQD